jgi:hypothetical protein
MPRVAFEPSISVFKRAKTIHVLDALDVAAIVIGHLCSNALKLKFMANILS